MKKKSLIFVLLITALALLSSCGGSGSRSVPSGMAGTWGNVIGGYAPYTLTITSDYFHFVDKDGYGFHIANPVWTRGQNPREDTRADFSTGYTLSGDITYNRYSDAVPFVALNRNGQILLNIDTSNPTEDQIILNQTASPTDVQDFLGTWERTTSRGIFIVISYDNFHLTDGGDTWSNTSHPTWLPAQNPREDTRAEFPEGFYFYGDEIDAGNNVLRGRTFFAAINRRGEMLLSTDTNIYQITFDKTSDSTARPATAPAATAATSPAPFR